jgi:DNA-binding transcriptional ArsR family regulator
LTAVADDRRDLLCLDLPRAEELRRARLEPADAERAAWRARAFADPTRLALAAALRDDELCVCDLAWVTERSDQLVSHHMRTLRSAGLAQSRRDGKMVMYSLTEEGASLLAATLAGVRAPA